MRTLFCLTPATAVALDLFSLAEGGDRGAGGSAGRPGPHRPGRIVLSGRIEPGPRREAEGRNFPIRLILDPGAVAQFLPTVKTKTP